MMAQVTSPYTIEIEEGCCVGSDCIPVVLTLKTALPITRRALRDAVRQRNMMESQSNAATKQVALKTQKKGCLLNIKDYCWTTEGSVTVTFSKMTPENCGSSHKSMTAIKLSTETAFCGLFVTSVYHGL
jgi:hypothetical protein